MARNYVRRLPNRGLNIVQPKAGLNGGQLYRAENVVFTRQSVKRRLGKLASHKPAVGVSVGVSLLKRFYNLATTGTITRFFIKAFGGVLYQTTTDWSDDTRSAIATASWTNILLPNTANKSLYSNYSSTTTTVASGAWQGAISSKSWCYLQADYSSADDNDKTEGVAVRTQGGKSFLHGLVPPAAIITADTEGGEIPDPSDFAWEGLDAAIGAALYTDVSFNSSGQVAIVYTDSTTTNVKVAIRTGGVWVVSSPYPASTAGFSTGKIDSSGVVHVAFYNTTGGANELVYANNSTGSFPATTTIDTTGDVGNYCRMELDASGNVHLAYYDTTNTALKYATNAGGSFTTETVDDSASVGTQIDMVMDSSGIPNVSYVDATNADILYAKRINDGTNTWTTEIAVDTVAAHTVGNHTSIDVTSNDDPGIVFGDTVNGDLYYVVKQAGSWGTPELIESTLNYDTADLVFDSSDIPFVMYHESTTTTAYLATSTALVGGTWSKTASLAIQKGWESMVYDDATDSFYVAVDRLGLKFEQLFRHTYNYRLTAEYDDAILGESPPSPALSVSLWRQTSDPINEYNSHTLDLDDSANLYDMTDDVTKIFIYRTIGGSPGDGTYYRVGSVDCTNGAPDSDFVDDVNDDDLVLGRILDVDRYMPPKWKTGAFWKDRLVIANLKCRKLDTTEGSLDSLDLEEGGIHKNRIRFSEGFHPDVFKSNFFQDILPDGDSGSIVRLIVNPQNDALFVFMENDVVALLDPIGDTVTSLSYRPRNIANSHGTPARHSVVEYEGQLFYWTKNGIEVINGLSSRNITSDTIGSLWNMTDANDPAYASRINLAQISKVAGVAHVSEDGERIMWAYPAATSSTNNRVLVLDYARWRDTGFQDDGVFSIWTMNISCWATWDGEGDRGELFGGESTSSRGPWVFRVGISNQDEIGNTVGTITTSAISPFYIHTGHDDAGTAERRKRWITARVDGRIQTVASTGSCSVVLAFDIDEGEVSGTMDTVTWTQGGIKRYSRNLPRAAIGVHGAVEITGTDGTPGASGGSPPFELHEIAMTVDDMPARTARG